MNNRLIFGALVGVVAACGFVYVMFSGAIPVGQRLERAGVHQSTISSLPLSTIAWVRVDKENTKEVVSRVIRFVEQLKSLEIYQEHIAPRIGSLQGDSIAETLWNFKESQDKKGETAKDIPVSKEEFFRILATLNSLRSLDFLILEDTQPIEFNSGNSSDDRKSVSVAIPKLGLKVTFSEDVVAQRLLETTKVKLKELAENEENLTLNTDNPESLRISSGLAEGLVLEITRDADVIWFTHGSINSFAANNKDESLATNPEWQSVAAEFYSGDEIFAAYLQSKTLYRKFSDLLDSVSQQNKDISEAVSEIRKDLDASAFPIASYNGISWNGVGKGISCYQYGKDSRYFNFYRNLAETARGLPEPKATRLINSNTVFGLRISLKHALDILSFESDNIWKSAFRSVTEAEQKEKLQEARSLYREAMKRVKNFGLLDFGFMIEAPTAGFEPEVALLLQHSDSFNSREQIANLQSWLQQSGILSGGRIELADDKSLLGEELLRISYQGTGWDGTAFVGEVAPNLTLLTLHKSYFDKAHKLFKSEKSYLEDAFAGQSLPLNTTSTVAVSSFNSNPLIDFVLPFANLASAFVKTEKPVTNSQIKEASDLLRIHMLSWNSMDLSNLDSEKRVCVLGETISKGRSEK